MKSEREVEREQYQLGEDLAKANIAYNDKSPHFKWRNFMGKYMYNLGYRLVGKEAECKCNKHDDRRYCELHNPNSLTKDK